MSSAKIKIFLSGDVMIGRGVDQILPHPCNPRLHEQGMRSALGYVYLAEDANGRVQKPVDYSYIWGAALAELERERPDARVINLETSITHSEDFAPKGINYRMSPENARCLLDAGIDCCALANNHVLDWGQAGLIETLSTLRRLKIQAAGAGHNVAEAWAPASLDIPAKGRVLVFSCADVTSGAPHSWAARRESPGIAILPDLSERGVALVANEVARARRPNDIVILSVHWGPNWGYEVPHAQRWFAHEVINRANVSILHGHSSHHAKGIEVYRNSLILYGCGDFLNDYEGIRGYDEFRGDLALMYIAQIEQSNGELAALEITPFQIRQLQLNRPAQADLDWLCHTVGRESKVFGVKVEAKLHGKLAVFWS